MSITARCRGYLLGCWLDPNTYNCRTNGDFDLFDNDLRDDDRNTSTSISEASDFIVDIREYDVPYHVRVMIDLGIYPCLWQQTWA